MAKRATKPSTARYGRPAWKCVPSSFADGDGRPLKIGDRVRIPLRDGGVRRFDLEGYPPRGTITGWVGCGVAEVRATKRGGRGANWAPGGRYDVSTSNLRKVKGKAR